MVVAFFSEREMNRDRNSFPEIISFYWFDFELDL